MLEPQHNYLVNQVKGPMMALNFVLTNPLNLGRGCIISAGNIQLKHVVDGSHKMSIIDIISL